ncbi:MAG: GNAT family N-acetyltransferase [bacterium]|nr:GNAT family N-acetyltransferase [bacterium]
MTTHETAAGDPGPALERLLGEAAAAADAADAEKLDLEAVAALEASTELDALLEACELDALAGLLERTTARIADNQAPESERERREAVWRVLDLVRRPAVLRRIDGNARPAWTERILAGVDASHLTVGPLFRNRARLYGSKTLLRVPRSGGVAAWSWRRAAARVEELARGLWLLVDEDAPAPIAILSENRVEMALVDLACLSSGLVNVLVPPNSTDDDVGYILKHSGAGVVVVSNAAQLRKVVANRERLPDLRHVVLIDTPQGLGVDGRQAERMLTLEQVKARGRRKSARCVETRGNAVRVDDLATIMYTSGTTGMPKGIRFSQRNLVFKRFARALALPEIGEDDRFLCFLPLAHTFGRFLELLGCVFWGATYCFLESPAVDAMIRAMRRERPSVFISVPKKWIQLYEAVAQRADPLSAPDEQLALATREVTGGSLRLGLSAAGHLDADIFRFFQRQGVELVSGFGMTEATGGATMTPPGEYRDGSLGKPLPGIDIELAEDGELLMRGPYVMLGYLDPPDGEPSFDDDGWFHSGDLMEIDAEGHIRLVDRKKEIYKNIKGETIAPQRVENLFRDLESVGRAFLVGDHREYNTLLIYPNPSYEELDFSGMPADEIRDHFRSLAVSVNQFLAPFERIVDFAIVDRDLDPERGELTAKGTPRRLTVARNFAAAIEPMYRRTVLKIGGVELTAPNWLLQALGLTAQDLRVDGSHIVFPSAGGRLHVSRHAADVARIGSCLYRHGTTPIDLGVLAGTPRLWLGNEALVRFLPLADDDRQRPGHRGTEIQWVSRATPFEPTEADVAALRALAEREAVDLDGIDHAARMIAARDPVCALPAVDYLESLLTRVKGPLAERALLVLSRASTVEALAVHRRALTALVAAEHDSRFETTLERFLDDGPSILDEATRHELCERDLSESRLESFVRVTREICRDSARSDVAEALLDFLAEYGAGHPVRYRRLRAFLTRMSLFADDERVRLRAAGAVEQLRGEFRQWLGLNAQIAVDPETGEEYRWGDVIVFDDDVPQRDRGRLLDAIGNTALLREALFLFSKALIRLSDIPPGGVWLRLLGSLRGKSVYRVTIQTRYQGHFDLAVNVNDTLQREEVQEEIHWLILGGESGDRAPLVEDFGGHWFEQDLWSEEFIAGETLARAMKRLARRDEERFRTIWPFLAWTALSGYVDFWERTGRRWEIADATMTNVVVPTDDYQTGVRIVSVSSRRHHDGILGMLRSFVDEFVRPAEGQYPQLAGLADHNVVFSSLLEIVGEEEGLALLEGSLRGGKQAADGELRGQLKSFISRVRGGGFRPRRLHFATLRYLRWEQLGELATPSARARTLQELYDTYGLAGLASDSPEVRVRFFRDTVFRDCAPALAEGLEELTAKLRSRELIGDELIDAVADLRSRLDLGPEEDYFLARLSLPYLRPEDAAGFVSSHLGGKHQSEIVVTLEDSSGAPFRVRHALNPKEVERLHRLFLAAKLDIRFRPEHRYLVALTERGQIAGGIYYETEEDGETAHLEKIVVSERFRRKGVADGLMNELFNRLRVAGIQTVTTGFFRPEYFYGYGFSIEKRYAGLVKALQETP